MSNNGNGEMHMGDYSFMGMHPFWLVSILVLVFLMLVLVIRFRKRK